VKIFIICPVREVKDSFKEGVEGYVKFLEEQGHQVHYPLRDTKQNASSFSICLQNRKAIEEADEVHIAWDGKLRGCLFDLGMAFAMNKKIRAITGLFPPPIRKKNFANFVHEWESLLYGY